MATENILTGKAWVFGDYIDVYKILSPEHWRRPDGKANLDAEILSKFAMVGVDPKFLAESQGKRYPFIVAGRNFGGGGKSTEQPIFTLKGAGVKAVIAESCSRYFFRNAVNNGLFVMTCEGITSKVATGDELEIRPALGEVKNLAKGIQLKSQPLSHVVLEILDSGGLLPYLQKRMKQSPQ